MTNKPTLMVIAAGNAKRMGDINVPKALYPINGEANLLHTLNMCDDMFSKIIIVIKNGMRDIFDDVITPGRVEYLEINSGLGDGHAILEALNVYNNLDDIVVMWGDAYLTNSDLIDEVIRTNRTNDTALIFPVVAESDPYVSVILDEADNGMIALAADFSKLGEKHSRGYHDQSIFRINSSVKYYLDMMHSTMWKNGRYISESGELNFLHVLHTMYNLGKPAKVFITSNSVMGFNTIEEVKKLEQTIQN